MAGPNAFAGSVASGSVSQPPGVNYNQIMGGVGFALKGLGQYQQAGAQRAMAISGKRSAAHALRETQRQSRYDQWLMSRRIATMHGTQRQAFAAAGVALKGTALKIMKESLLNMNRDKAMAKYNAEQKVIGLRRAIRDYKRAAKKAKKSQTFGAIGSVVSAVGMFAGPPGLLAAAGMGISAAGQF